MWTCGEDTSKFTQELMYPLDAQSHPVQQQSIHTAPSSGGEVYLELVHPVAIFPLMYTFGTSTQLVVSQ